ncbi:App1 family protein [Chitinophaga sp. HK235]|uniref:App1 family protein n=1 Tax=Chitinophaga sp. HK235 TaxID=2952571 RepID=UPI001BAA5C17|nr:phosphatase domain-containing protein [Chitinophaga sp. HK235]
MYSSRKHKYNAAKKSLSQRLWNSIGISTTTVVKVYRGYGHDGQLQLFGHVLTRSPAPEARSRGNVWLHIWSLLRLFMVQPKPNAAVQLEWQGKIISARTADDGFFHFQWQPEYPTAAGWHPVTVTHVQQSAIIATGYGELYIPHRTQYGCISDIDDTFLISHSSHLYKKLYVLLTHNASSRKPFEGVVHHYQLLSHGHTTPAFPNPFFYVSSSEWNLYDYIREFADAWQLPQGVYLLNQLKRFTQLVNTGQGKHNTKFTRIARILESYPHMPFVLLGDDTQQDPYIYEAIARHFPQRILCVYLRHVSHKNKAAVEAAVGNLQALDIACCYFQHSAEAITHSRQVGLIPPLLPSS